MPRSGFVVIETEFVLGGLEAVFNGPTMAFNLDQCLNRCSCGAPRGEISQITIGDVAPDQQTARPPAMVIVVTHQSAIKVTNVLYLAVRRGIMGHET
jgi:hypothetical protein